MTQQPAGENKYDTLKIAGNSQVLALLKAEGPAEGGWRGSESYEEKKNILSKFEKKTHGEYLIFSEKLVKINNKGKKQDRVLLITNKAIYNTKPGKYGKSQRRIPITEVGMVTVSTTSPEFVFHVPSQYDYHMASRNKTVIADKLAELYSKLKDGEELLIIQSELKHLKDLVLSKKLAAYAVYVFFFFFLLCCCNNFFEITDHLDHHNALKSAATGTEAGVDEEEEDDAEGAEE
ncbi:hypothetical protein RFI_16479 [Reticulomyxa filosa]|uniref:TH1 domain-containing protein n=1 Tax=Reticulomyxa filosa TaxID=46433 RepID=X6N4P8_RETFI|nr:hypothetical protein RFI_16479 [Reticulomyxa filosa]|eukprot:ETO20739.1 hypothetical protein RFI_16479 [Reticulomyxa filosa]